MNATLRKPSSWIEPVARLGFAAKGVVYLLIALLAVQAARGRGETGGGSDALRLVLGQPFGRALLIGIAIGLLGYTLWRVIDAVRDASGQGSDTKGIAARIFTAAKGLAYAGLGIEAFRLATRQASGGGEGAQHWTGRALDAPFGRALVIAAGLFLIGYAVFQIYNAFRSKLSKGLELERLRPDVRKAVRTISRIGLAARGIVFIIIGWLLAGAGLARNAGQAQEVSGALASIRDEKFGPTMLFVIAIGLAAYGIYQLVNAKYRRINVTARS